VSSGTLPFRLYAVTDRNRLGGRPLEDALAVLCAHGVKGVQVREKDLDEPGLEALAARCRAVFDRYAVAWLLNGPVAVALRTGAGGVHLTELGDLAAARTMLGAGRLLAKSAHGVEAARAAAVGGADFVVVGPVFATASKAPFGPPLGLGVLAEACAAAAPCPVFAIGGVTPERARACRDAGAHGVAAIGPLMSASTADAAVDGILERYADALGGL
jgi:thiamine-phosphate pyrophosphorylase